MLSTQFPIVLVILIVTTLYVVVCTILFAQSQRAVQSIDDLAVDAGSVAEHLASAVR